MARYIAGIGERAAKILIVGEFPSREDELKGVPFSGSSGHELGKMLHEAGILRSECFLTNVLRTQVDRYRLKEVFPTKKSEVTASHIYLNGVACSPWVQDHIADLIKEIEEVKPNVIIALGEIALWALTGKSGIMSWRGSELAFSSPNHSCKVIPSIAPSLIMRQWSWRVLAVNDLRRAAKASDSPELFQPSWQFSIRPTFDQVLSRITELLALLEAAPLKLSVDIETRHGHIACLGFAWNKSDAICIPFMCVENDEGYWTLDEEHAIIKALQKLLCHKNVEVIGQNFAYDAQHIIRHWGFAPLLHHDTMVKQSVLFAGMTKALDFLSSMYCEHHLYWKDDGKHWDPKVPEEQLWTYNCVDCVRTYEVNEALSSSLCSSNLEQVYQFQIRLWYAVLAMMYRGVAIDHKNRGSFAAELFSAITDREQRITSMLGHPLNVRSSKQMKELFYDDFALPVQKNLKTGQPSLDDKSMTKLCEKEPLIKPLVSLISDIRSLGVFLSTFVQAPLDSDQRMRCSFNIAGTETYRFSSSSNAFDSGTNLQNIPKGSEDAAPGQLALPNVRKLFIPDPGHIIFDVDLDRADLQVVVWEADDKELKQMLREGVDMHSENAKALQCSRAMAKAFVHGTNYGGGPRTMAMNCGITTHQADVMQKRWFAAHPGIHEWHRRTEQDLFHKREVRNRFGYRKFFFDRVEGLLPEALAWIPQSTVACVINRALLNVAVNLPEIKLLLQVHDSLVGQVPEDRFSSLLKPLHQNLLITIPYPDPLIIPCGIKYSRTSWGEVKDLKWPV